MRCIDIGRLVSYGRQKYDSVHVVYKIGINSEMKEEIMYNTYN